VGEFWRTPQEGVVLGGIGLGRSLVGGHFLLALPPADRLARSMGMPKSLADERFLVEPLEPRMAWALTVTGVATGIALLGWTVAAGRRLRREGIGSRRAVMLVLGAGLAAYCAFFVVWEPENLEFWIPQSVFIWLLLVGASPMAGAPGARRWLAVAVGIAVALGVVNFTGSIRWLTKPERDHGYHYAQVVSGVLSGRRPGLVLLKQEWIVSKYIRRYTGANVIGFDWASSRRRMDEFEGLVAHEVRTTLEAGGIVLLDDSRTEEGPRADAVRRRALDAIWDGYVARSRRVTVERYTFWLLEADRSVRARVW
jgi:hypothetical protein